MGTLKLDTLDKKPKVYSLAILTGAVLVLLTVVFLLGKPWMVRFSCLLLSLYFLAAAALLVQAFFRQIRYNLYSYNTIIYFGFSLFFLSIALTYALMFLNSRDVPAESMVQNVLGWLLGSAKTYAMFTFPFLLLFSIALVISNLALIRHEGFRPVNLLGIALALCLVSGEVFLYLRDYAVSGSVRQVMLYDLLTNLLAAVYLYFECMMLGTVVADLLAARYEPKMDKDFIIVLGCAIRRDGTPTPLLRGRLDRALAFAKAQEAETGKAPVFILSGGQGVDECVSEAECMRRYLAAQGVPADQMLSEDKSTDTAENMAFSKRLILDRIRPGMVDPQGYWPTLDAPEARVAFSTTNYHVFRSGLKARQIKLRAQGMGCRSKWYFWPNAAVREFVGLLTQHRVKQGLILLGMILFYVGLTVIYYTLGR